MMEKLKLKNGKEFNLRIDGVQTFDDMVSVKIVNPVETLTELEGVFVPANTERMEVLAENGDVLRILNDYTFTETLKKEPSAVIKVELDGTLKIGVVVTVELRKENKMEKRVTSLENAVDMLVIENLGGASNVRIN